MTMIIVAAAVAMIPSIVIVAMSVALAVIVVIFDLAVVVAVIVANFLAIFAAMEIPFPSAMPAPVSVLAANGELAMVAEVRIIGAVDVAAETDGAVEPGTGSEEHSAGEPGGSVITKWGASIGGVVEVPIWAYGLNTDVDGDLYFCFEGRSREAEKR
jgi:hypothetical protein